MAQGSKAQQIKSLRSQGKKAEADLLARGGATKQQAFQERDRSQGNVAGGGRYIVQDGDSYFSIAGNVYGDQRFFEQLQLYNPYIKNLRPGMTIKLPRFDTTRDPTVSFKAADEAGLDISMYGFDSSGQQQTGYGYRSQTSTTTAGGGIPAPGQGQPNQYGGLPRIAFQPPAPRFAPRLNYTSPLGSGSAAGAGLGVNPIQSMRGVDEPRSLLRVGNLNIQNPLDVLGNQQVISGATTAQSSASGMYGWSARPINTAIAPGLGGPSGAPGGGVQRATGTNLPQVFSPEQQAAANLTGQALSSGVPPQTISASTLQLFPPDVSAALGELGYVEDGLGGLVLGTISGSILNGGYSSPYDTTDLGSYSPLMPTVPFNRGGQGDGTVYTDRGGGYGGETWGGVVNRLYNWRIGF